MNPKPCSPAPSCEAAAKQIPLTEARCGEKLRIVNVAHQGAASTRLRELGFCESVEVCKVLGARGNCICLLAGTRIALGSDLAAQVLVERLR